MIHRRFLSIAARRLVILLLAGLTGLAHGADRLLMAAGAGYRKPVMELVDRFTAQTGIPVDVSLGNMKQVETQTRQNPAIALVAGDRAFLEPMDLFEGFAVMGRGKPMLIAARGVELATLKDLEQPRFRRIATPDRNKAVYGRAARTCLERSGMLASLGERLLEVATVPQVGTYVATGEVDAGFVNLTEAQALGDRIGAVIELPASCHDPIEIVLGSVRGRADAAPVRAFIDFLSTPDARAILQRHGL